MSHLKARMKNRVPVFIKLIITNSHLKKKLLKLSEVPLNCGQRKGEKEKKDIREYELVEESGTH